MNFTDLTPTQLDQAEGMFFDAIFGTDPHAFDYEANADGVITGRRPLQMRPKGKCPRKLQIILTSHTATSGPDNRPAIRHLARMALPFLEHVEVSA